jgi:hypothetical protein
VAGENCVLRKFITCTARKIRGVVKKFPEFFDIDGFVHHEFVPHVRSVTDHLYAQVLQRLRNAVRKE